MAIHFAGTRHHECPHTDRDAVIDPAFRSLCLAARGWQPKREAFLTYAVMCMRREPSHAGVKESRRTALRVRPETFFSSPRPPKANDRASQLHKS
jgi:hypothetical protein